jgi:hypothetical protein
MYVISFALPFGDGFEIEWGHQAFWGYFSEIFSFSDTDYVTWALPTNLSNIAMILLPILVAAISARKLAVIILLGGLHSLRFLQFIGENGTDHGDFFPAYYVWSLSFFVSGIALWRAPTLRAA